MPFKGRCPRCGGSYEGHRDNKTMGRHRDPKKKEWCRYGGGTLEDAVKHIPPLWRRTQAAIVARCKAERRLPNAPERKVLTERKMLGETMVMVRDA
jgi:hypothetical protein